jgi:hypothetical protein
MVVRSLLEGTAGCLPPLAPLPYPTEGLPAWTARV